MNEKLEGHELRACSHASLCGTIMAGSTFIR